MRTFTTRHWDGNEDLAGLVADANRAAHLRSVPRELIDEALAAQEHWIATMDRENSAAGEPLRGLLSMDACEEAERAFRAALEAVVAAGDEPDWDATTA